LESCAKAAVDTRNSTTADARACNFISFLLTVQIGADTAGAALYTLLDPISFQMGLFQQLALRDMWNR